MSGSKNSGLEAPQAPATGSAARSTTDAPAGLSPELQEAALALMAGRPADAGWARRAGASAPEVLIRRLKRALGLTPQGFAELGSAQPGGDDLSKSGGYAITYGGSFNPGQILRYLGRDPGNLAERVEGSRYTRFFPLEDQQVLLTLEIGPKACRVEFHHAPRPEARLALHRALRRFLGLEQPLRAFYRAMEGDAVMGPVIRRNRGLRIPQVPSLWEALCWAVIGQQINLAFAYRLRNRFIALGNGIGGGIGGGMVDDARDAGDAAGAGNGAGAAEIGAAREAAESVTEGAPASSGVPLPFPTPAQVLTIPAPAWRPAQFSRQKTAYLGGLARAFEEGTLSQPALESAPLEEAEATLRAVKGLGPWSVAYGMLRALGRVDALPVGDAGLRAALRHHYRLEAMPDARAQVELMETFRPYRGLATTYFWRSLDQVRKK